MHRNRLNEDMEYHAGHKYMTLVYQIDKGSRRLLWVGKDRIKKTLRGFCTDMWNLDRKFRNKYSSCLYRYVESVFTCSQGKSS